MAEYAAVYAGNINPRGHSNIETANIASTKAAENEQKNTQQAKTGKIAVLNSPKGAHGQGHLGILIQGKDGKFTFWAKNGTHESSGVSGPSDKGDQPGVGSFNSAQDFMVSSYNPIIDDKTGEREYSEGYLMTTDNSNYQREIDAIKGELDLKYDVTGSNCATTVQAVVFQNCC